LRTVLGEKTIDYDGSQLRSDWLQQALGLEPDSEGAAGAFVGACDVRPEMVVDLDEVRSGEPIRAARMLHFIAEFPDRDLEKTVYRQRLLAAAVSERLAEAAPGRSFRRRGDDVYEHGSKVTVSIATLSPVSSLLHFGVNIDPAGAPVAAAGLADFGVEPRGFGREVLAAFAAEMSSSRLATARVRQVR
jgi:hypothetical protein